MIIAYDCKKPYAPKAVASDANYLIVEGMINTGHDSTVLTLSRSIKISAKKDSMPELGAQVTVEDADNKIYPLTEMGAGRYGAADLGLDSTQQYRVRIKTTNGKVYVSDLVQPKSTPPIDSVGFNMVNNGIKTGIQVYVNTHDPKNDTYYYRWDYKETWQFHSEYYSTFISDGNSIIYRTPDQNVHFCFDNHISTDVTIGSSAKLQRDLIYQQPVIFIESTSEKIEARYSILVKQFALTKDAFNYWQNLKKNTEELGSIFDAQPTQLTGNIHCISDQPEPVIGYISAGSVKQKRIYIDRSQLPDSWQPNYPYACRIDPYLFCAPPYCTNQVARDLIPQPNTLIPVYALEDHGIVIGYTGSSIECIDCTIRGTKQQPAFWR